LKLKCVNLISDYKDVFTKNEVYEASEPRNGFCEVSGNRKRKDGLDWLAVASLGHYVVLGVAKFEIVKEDDVGSDAEKTKPDSGSEEELELE